VIFEHQRLRPSSDPKVEHSRAPHSLRAERRSFPPDVDVRVPRDKTTEHPVQLHSNERDGRVHSRAKGP